MSTKINVLQVIPKLGYGGAETGCYDIAHYLAEKECGSYIVTSGGELLKFVNKEKVKIFRLPVNSKNPILIILNTLILSLFIIFFKINIVHARSRAPAWSCYLACILTRTVFVTTFHGTYNFKNKLKKFYNSIMLRAELTIAGSNFIFSHINQNYQKYLKLKKQKLMVIFRGINLEFFNEKNTSEKKMNALVESWKIDKKKFIILLPGRLTKWKGQELFIESLSLLLEEHKKENFQAIILGSNQGREVYSKKLSLLVERHRLKKKIIFIESCKEMPVAYALSDLVVSSSIEPETFGRVAVEAQAMHKPIIASNIGGSRETVLNGKTGLLYNYNDQKELAKGINKFMEMNKKSLSLMGEQGRKNVEKKFNVDQMCQSTFTEYKKLLK